MFNYYAYKTKELFIFFDDTVSSSFTLSDIKRTFSLQNIWLIVGNAVPSQPKKPFGPVA